MQNRTEEGLQGGIRCYIEKWGHGLKPYDKGSGVGDSKRELKK